MRWKEATTCITKFEEPFSKVVVYKQKSQHLSNYFSYLFDAAVLIALADEVALKFCIYGHKISKGYSMMTDNLKRAGIFRKSVYLFLRCPFLIFTFRILGVFVDEL